MVILYVRFPLSLRNVEDLLHERGIDVSHETMPYLKMPNGRALTGQSHDYKRHGTMTLFAALNVATGKVSGRQYKRRRRIEFLDFMNSIVAKYPDRELHVILDNLNTHKPKNDLLSVHG